MTIACFQTPRRGHGSTLRSLFLCGGFYVLFIHLLIIIKYTSIYTDYLLQKEITNISVCSFHKQGHWVFALLFVKVFSFFALFLWPCLRAQVAVLGIVSSPSVEVVNFVFLGHLFPWLKNLCNATAFSFSDLLCQVNFEHCKWDNGELNSKSPWPYSAPFNKITELRTIFQRESQNS